MNYRHLFTKSGHKRLAHQPCHPERSEGSLGRILRCAQNDTPVTSHRKVYKSQVFPFSLALLVLLLTAGSVCAGPGSQNTPCLREQNLFPHICKGGANAEESCSVTADGFPDCVVIDNGDCGEGGKCVIDYTSKKEIKVKISVMLDDDATTDQQSVNRALTILLCVKHQGESHCFTETYLGDLSSTLKPINIPPLITTGESNSWGVYETFTTQTQALAETVHRLGFSAPEGLLMTNPEGDLAQELRDLFEVTGLPVVTDIGPASSVHFDNHVDDLTGSVLRFDATLRFINK
jgi:hypothetical protein